MKPIWIDIDGSIRTHKTTEEEFTKEFLEWLESKGWQFIGTMIDDRSTKVIEDK